MYDMNRLALVLLVKYTDYLPGRLDAWTTRTTSTMSIYCINKYNNNKNIKHKNTPDF